MVVKVSPNITPVTVIDNGVTHKVVNEVVEVKVAAANVVYNVSGGGSVTFNAVNATGSTISSGSLVALSASGVILATASISARACEGMATQDIISGDTGEFIKYGVLELSDWSGIIGSSDLSVNQDYFLSNTAGKLTTTPIGSVITQKIGKAITARKLLVNPQISIRV